MGALGISETRKVEFSECEDFALAAIPRLEQQSDSMLLAYLIDTTKLEINPKVLLVESLQSGVQEPTQKRTINLLHNLRAGFLCIVLRDSSTQLVVVEVVLFRELVGRSLYKAKGRSRDAERLEDGAEEELVVLSAVRDQF